MHLAAMMSDLAMSAPALWVELRSAWGSFADGAGGTLITSVWQGAVIVCGLEIALRMMPRISAAHRFAVWAAGFGVAAGLPLLPLIPFGVSGGVAGGAGPGVAAGHAQALLQIDARWGLAIAGLWLAASIMRASSLVVHSLRLRRLWKAARPVEVSEKLAGALENVRGGRVTICTTEMLYRPSVIGFLAPRILIPTWLMVRMTEGELEQIVLHEAEHLRRGDDWTNLVQKLALGVFPLNPALAWMEHRLCSEREMACDEGVVRITNAPRTYAACLASLAEYGLERSEALSLGAWGKRSELVRRVQRILLRKRRMNRAAAGALLGAVGCALLGATVEMARLPQLVAFVPEEKTLAMTAARQEAMTAMLARESAESKMMLPAGYHAAQTKAVIPATPVNPRHAARKSAVQVKAAPGAGLEQIAEATGGDRVNPSADQQWVVLAAWEEVHTVSHGADEVSDYDVPATIAEQAASQPRDGKAADQQKGAAPGQGGSHYTFTQLILRVVPAHSSSNSTQPAAIDRGGWLVIQL